MQSSLAAKLWLMKFQTPLMAAGGPSSNELPGGLPELTAELPKHIPIPVAQPTHPLLPLSVLAPLLET